MWRNFDGKPYTRKAWLAHVDSLDIHLCGWIKFITLHNTSSPTIAQWQSYPEQQRIMNLESYYEHSLGWHAGPHGFIPPDESEHNENGTVIFGFTDLDTPGVHASCFNHRSLGFEMVGEFNVSPFDTPPGSYVRDNAVFVLAALYNKLGLSPDNYIYNVRGLHFHIECARDNHDCPGTHARNKPWWINAIKTKMVELKGKPLPPVDPPEPPPAPGVVWNEQILMTEFAGPNDRRIDRIDGYTGQIIDYRKPLMALPYHFPDWVAFRAEIDFPPNRTSVVNVSLGDIGPWYSVVGPDKYWEKHTRPRAESNKRTNGAGLDATQGVFDALGIQGPAGYRQARVNWRRVT